MYFFSQDVQFLPLTKLNTKDLLPSLNARKIIRDKFGFMWIATQDGVYRFDGMKHSMFNNGQKDDRFLVIGTDFFDISNDGNGDNIWALSGVGGLNKISTELGTVVDTFSLSVSSGIDIWAKCMLVVDNYIYVGTAQGLVLKFDIKQKRVVDIFSVRDSKKRNEPVEKIIKDGNNNIWVLVSSVGIVVASKDFSKMQIISEKTFYKESPIEFTDCAIYKNFIIVSSVYGILTINVDKRRAVNNRELFENEAAAYLKSNIECITVFSDSIFFAGPGILMCSDIAKRKFEKIVFSSYKDDEKWLLYASCLLFDGVSLWLGSQYGTGIIKDPQTPFTGYFESMDASYNRLGHCYSVFHSNSKDKFICTDDGTYYLNLKRAVFKKISATNLYYSGICVSNKLLIVSGTNGTELLSIDGQRKKMISAFPELKVICKEVISSMVSLNDSLFFFAGFVSKKIYCWDKVRKTAYEIKNIAGTEKGFSLNGLFIDSKKLIWIIFDGSTSIYNPVHHTLDNINISLPAGHVPLRINMDMCEVGQKLWIAAYGTGLVKMSVERKLEKIYSLKDGIANVGLYKIFSLDDSLIIASSNNGITILNTNTNKIKNYFEEDGLHGNNFEQFSGDKYDDTIFLGGTNGFTIIDTKKIRFKSTFPKIYFTSASTENGIVSKDTFNLQLQKLYVPSDVIQTSVDFSAIDYISSNKDSFAYRILEVSKQWLSLGSLRTIKLIGFAPGSYTLQVKNVQTDDNDLAKPIELTLIFQPKWYQTLWFDFAVAMAVLGLFYGFYRYRIRQIQKQQHIRVDIASDLHDDIGSALNTVKVFTHLAKRDVDKEEHINQIEESLTQATTGLRDMIWILDDTQDTLQEIVERIKKFALPVAMAHGITLQCINLADKSEQAVSKTKKRNLMLIAKEAINNSIKYSECKNLQVVINQTNKKVSLIIKDDGKGFNKLTSPKGNGLGNIQHRAKQINAVAEIISAEGEGTIIKVAQK